MPSVLIYRGLQKVSGNTGGVVILLDIIFPVLLAFLIFGEVPSLVAAVGGVLIVVGSYIVAMQEKKEILDA